MARSLLLVDDEAALLRTMREFFELRGFDVTCATEMEEALALLEHHRYAVVICDVCLQGLRDAEGLEVVAHIRSTNPGTRIIILTGLPRGDLRQRAAKQDADRFLLKPHPLPLLAAAVEELLSGDHGDRHEHAP